MASEFIEWTPFAKANKLAPAASRQGLDIDVWIKEKRDLIAREQAETIADAVFDYRSRWHVDVLKTLKEYPEANDAMLGLLKRRLNDIIGMVNDDDRRRAEAAKTGQSADVPSNFAKIKNNELASLAAAIKVCTESKHKSLMIHDWSFKVAETFSDPKQFGTLDEKISDMEWKVQIMGGENLGHKEMQAFLASYYDKPLMPHTPVEVETASKSGEGD